MTVSIEQAYIDAFNDNVHVLLEQRESKLRPVATVTNEIGEHVFFDTFGSLQASEISGRWQEVSPQDSTHAKRVISMRRYGCPAYVDKIDELKMMMDPTSYIVQAVARAHGRNIDDVLIAAMLGSATTGRAADGSASFDSNMVVANGSTGFTVAKLNKGLKLLVANEVDIDREELFLLLGAEGEEDLMADSLFTSFDYQSGKVLADGRLPKFRGVNIIRHQSITDATSGSVARGLLLSGRAMRLNIAQDINVRVDELPQMNHAVLVNAYMQFGAVRMEEGLIADIQYAY